MLLVSLSPSLSHVLLHIRMILSFSSFLTLDSIVPFSVLAYFFLGLQYSRLYGFGLVDAAKAVEVLSVHTLSFANFMHIQHMHSLHMCSHPSSWRNRTPPHRFPISCFIHTRKCKRMKRSISKREKEGADFLCLFYF